MAIRKTAYSLKELCNELDIPLDLLQLVRENKDYVAYHLLANRPKKIISEVIDDFIKQLNLWVNQDVISDRTALNYLYFLMPFNAFIKQMYPETDISQLTSHIFNEFVSTRKSFKGKQITVGTRNTYLKYIRKLLYYAIDMGYLFLNDGERHIKTKFRWSTSQRLPKYVPEEIAKEVLKLTLQTREPYRNHAMVCFLLGTGARVAELIKVKICDINFNENSVKLTGKFNKTRRVTLYPFLKKVILSYIHLRGVTNVSSNELLFTTNYGKQINRQMTESTVQKMIYMLFKKLGYPNAYSTHCFRHSFAVNCLKAGMKIEFIAELLGHENIETTMIYTKLLPEDLLEEVQNYPIPLEKILFTIIGMED